jgi:hypothetical protein
MSGKDPKLGLNAFSNPYSIHGYKFTGHARGFMQVVRGTHSHPSPLPYLHKKMLYMYVNVWLFIFYNYA